MKTLKEIAATFNLYTAEDIPAQYRGERTDDRIKSAYQNDDKLLPSFLTALPGYEVGLFFKCDQDTNYKKETIFYIEDNCYPLLKRNDSELIMMVKQQRDGKYYLYPYHSYMWKYHDVDYHVKTEALKALTEPNRIGVFSEKKVAAWVDYCIQQIAALDAATSQLQAKNNGIQSHIDSFIKSMPGCKVDTYQRDGCNVTDVETELFRVYFVHNEKTAYLKTETDFLGTLNNAATLQKLFDNLK